MGAVQVPKTFADDFDAACRWWQRIGQAEDIPEIREAARLAFANGEDVDLWAAWVKDIAGFQRGLERMATGINQSLSVARV